MSVFPIASTNLPPRFPATVLPVRKPRNWVAGALIMIGISVGFLAGLSQQVGTASTLIGLLIALIGGTFLPQATAGERRLADRTPALRAGGLICLGVMIGVCLAFLLRRYESEILIPRQRAAYITFLLDLKRNDLLDGPVEVTLPGSLIGGTPSFTLNSTGPNRSKSNPRPPSEAAPPNIPIQAIDAALGKQPDGEQKNNFLELRAFIKYSTMSAQERQTAYKNLADGIPDGSDTALITLRDQLRETK